MDSYIDRLVNIDPTALWPFIVDTLRNPSLNPTAFGLILGGLSIVTVMLVLVLVAVFLGGPEDEDEYEDEYDDEGRPSERRERAARADEPEFEEEPGPSRFGRVATALFWFVAFGAVWIAGGVVTRQDTMCLSCHQGAMIHAARLDNAKEDPHAGVRCASCHESPDVVAGVTTAIPGRAWHYAGSMLATSFAEGYGTPVANSSCRGCHREVATATYENKVRGIRVSHREPLDAKARCSDCHKPRPTTGVINSLTVGMETCLRCHDERTASAECSYCHTKDVGYALTSRGTTTAKRHESTLDCGLCHDQRRCDACHGARMPHTRAFMGPGHARAAVEDIWYNGGKTCKKCHTPNRRPCQKCHTSFFPSHPSPIWSKHHQAVDPINNSCDRCHSRMAWMTGRNFCGNCHPKLPPRRSN